MVVQKEETNQKGEEESCRNEMIAPALLYCLAFRVLEQQHRNKRVNGQERLEMVRVKGGKEGETERKEH